MCLLVSRLFECNNSYAPETEPNLHHPSFIDDLLLQDTYLERDHQQERIAYISKSKPYRND